MRKILILLSLFSLILVASDTPSVQKSEAAENDETLLARFLQTPGTRCTRLTYSPRTSAKRVSSADTGLAMPGTRCSRLTSGPRKGKMLPNTGPKVGLSASTAYIGINAPAEVKLRAIACDPDDDTVLYTYTATAGRIEGDGSDVVWNLAGVGRPGEYIVTVEVDDGCGCVSFTSTQVTVGSAP